MNEYDVRKLAEIFAIQAEIEGMKADNEQRKINTESPAYTENAFRAKAEELRILAC
jgi:hypothetical protein